MLAWLRFLQRVSRWAVATPGWRVVYNMSIRTGRQASTVALFFFLLALTALVYGAVIVSFSGPVPEEEIEVPIEEA